MALCLKRVLFRLAESLGDGDCIQGAQCAQQHAVAIGHGVGVLDDEVDARPGAGLGGDQCGHAVRGNCDIERAVADGSRAERLPASIHRALDHFDRRRRQMLESQAERPKFTIV